MRADFFRNLFHKTAEGIYYTAALKDEIRKMSFHLAYIAEEAKPVDEEKYLLNLLAVADWKEGTIRQARQMIAGRSVEMAVLPHGTFTQEAEMKAWCEEHGVEEVHFVEKAWLHSAGRWEFRFLTMKGDEGNTLVLYQGFTGDDLAKEDCAFAAKPFSRENCHSCLCEEDDHCGFGCSYRNDFDVLKRHKGKDSKNYRMGTLLLGSAILKGEGLPKEFLRDVEAKIRCVQLPYGTEKDHNYVCELFGNTEHYLYVVGHHKGCSDLQAGHIANTSPWLRYTKIDSEHGFCASGYRIPYMKSEKGC